MSTATAGDLRSRIAAIIRRVAGMPEYHRYVEHLRSRHPGAPIPDEKAYYAEYVKRRYEGGGSRCC